MCAPAVPSAFIRSLIFVTIIMSSTIKLSAESTSPSSVNQNSLGQDIKQINSTDSPSPVSEEERLRYLDELQGETTQAILPTVLFLILLAVTGLIGNSLVIFVYSLKFKRSATRIIIITIAVFDLVANVLAIPGDIYDMFNTWDFDNPTLCRVSRFFSAFTTLSSALALLAVAVVRYRKICAPHGWQITTEKAKVVSVVVAIIGFLFSIPYAILNGRQTKPTPRPDIFGYECTTDDSYVNTKWPLLNYGFFLVLFICCGVPLTVLYVLVGVQAWKHRKRHTNSSRTVSLAKRKTAPHPSSENYQSQLSQSTNSTSDVTHNGRALDSSDNRGVFSTSNENAQSTNLSEIVEQVDQCKVRICQDRVEIRTPVMAEMVANLLKATSGLESVTGNHDITHVDLTTRTENIGDLDQDTGCRLLTGSRGDQHPVHSPTWGTESFVRYSDVSVDDGEKNSSKGVSEKNDCPPVGCRTEIKLISVTTSPKEQRTEETNRASTIYTEQRTEATKYPTSSHREKRTEQQTFTVNSKAAGNLAGSFDFSPKISKSCRISWEETAVYKQSWTGDFSQTRSDLDPIAALNWLDIVYCPEGGQATTNPDIVYCPEGGHATTNPDIVYCPEGGHATTNPDAPKTGNRITFRISPSNNLLEKADWLRDIIVEAVAKSTPRSTRSGEVGGLTETENVELRTIKIGNKINTNDNNHFSRKESVKLGSILPSENRLKRLITKKSYILRGSKKRQRKEETINRTTVMLIVISAVYVIGFLPHLALMFFKFAAPEKFASLTPAEFSIHNVFVKSFFLNSAANPIIYSLCDRNFRRECIGLFSRC